MQKEIKHSIIKSDNGKVAPAKFELVFVDDADCGLCLGGKNFSTGRIFALYKDCVSCNKDLGLDLPDLPLIELTKVSDVHKSKDHNYYYSVLANKQEINKNIVEQVMVLYGNKT